MLWMKDKERNKKKCTNFISAFVLGTWKFSTPFSLFKFFIVVDAVVLRYNLKHSAFMTFSRSWPMHDLGLCYSEFPVERLEFSSSLSILYNYLIFLDKSEKLFMKSTRCIWHQNKCCLKTMMSCMYLLTKKITKSHSWVGWETWMISADFYRSYTRIAAYWMDRP